MTVSSPAALLVAGVLALQANGGLGAHRQSSPSGEPHAGTRQAAAMRAHFAQAMVVHGAIIRGDFAAVAPAVEELGRQVRLGQAASSSALLEAARDAAEARDILGAAVATARIFAACGRCHRAAGVVPVFPAPPRPPADGLVGHMQEHQSAADRLLQGLVVPSDESWRNGARALASAPLHAQELPPESPRRREMALTEERLHRLATSAAQTTDVMARAGFYGQFLAGCAECHQAARQQPPR